MKQSHPRTPDAGTARWRRSLLWLAGLLALFSLLLLLPALRLQAQTAEARAAPQRTAFKVCQDPNNLPFANLKGEGLENRIAELFASALGLPLSYYSVPQRFNFVRNTLRYKLPGEDYPCDILMAVPVGFDQVSVTRPYYRSTYALVFARGKGLDQVHSGDDFLRLDPALLAKLRIGLYDRTPASAWLSRHHLVDQGVPYSLLNADPDQYPGQMIEKDLAGGRLDVAIVWGPIAGFFAQRVKTPPLQVVPLQSEPGVRFDYQMAMGVRYGEPEWQRQIEGLIDSRHAEIQAILRSYGVPVLDDAAPAGRAEDAR